MQCPVCQEHQLVMSERQGIEIDYCPHCRGVWLDRGELDKIIERSATQPAAAPVAASSPPPVQHHPRSGDHHHYPKRRKSFLEELFD